MNKLVSGNFIASRGVSSPAVAVSVTFAMMIVMPTIRIVCYTSKAFQVVPTFAPMNVLTLGNSIASREVISPAVAVSVAFAKMVAMVDIRYLSTRRMLDCDRFVERCCETVVPYAQTVSLCHLAVI